MPLLIQLVSFFWLIRTIKFVLFWIYLWQLKEYHIGRFIDNFRTYKGKKIFFNSLYISKLIFLVALFASYYLLPLIFYILLLIYTVESITFLYGIFKNTFKKPVLTAKTVFLIFISCIFTILFLSKTYILEGNFPFIISLLLFDIFTPFIISCIVLFFQPFFVVKRNSILKKAKEKVSKYKNLMVIGITGSYGKTSTKEFLTTILSSKFNVLSTKDHQNSEMGIASCILNNLNENHQIFVVEMGSYKKGGISLLCDIIKPKIGIVAGVNEQHLALFGSMKNLLSAEGGLELVKSLKEGSFIVVNGDNKYCLDLYKKVILGQYQDKLRVKIYTLKNDKIDSDIWVEELTVKENLLDFVAIDKNKQAAHFNVSVLGKQNVQNILASILVAKELGMSLEEISSACRNILQKQAGITIKNGVYGINIIDSSYSSNKDGVMADLDYLNIFPGKKVIIMPCLIELGSKSWEIHREIGKKIAEVCDMAIIVTKEKFEAIKNVAIEKGMQEDNIIFSDNPKEIFHIVTTFCKEGDAVLLDGRVPKTLINLLTNNGNIK